MNIVIQTYKDELMKGEKTFKIFTIGDRVYVDINESWRFYEECKNRKEMDKFLNWIVEPINKYLNGNNN